MTNMDFSSVQTPTMGKSPLLLTFTNLEHSFTSGELHGVSGGGGGMCAKLLKHFPVLVI